MREEGKNCRPPARCVPATTNQCNNILPSTKLSNPRQLLINATFINSRHTPYTQSIINVVPQDNRYASIVLAVQVSLRVSPSQEISSCTEMGYIFLGQDPCTDTCGWSTCPLYHKIRTSVSAHLHFGSKTAHFSHSSLPRASSTTPGTVWGSVTLPPQDLPTTLDGSLQQG